MTAIPYVFENAPSSEAYVLDLLPATGVDLSLVVSAELYVKRPDGSRMTWTVTLSLQTATTLRLTHAYAAGDTSAIGPHVVYARLFTAGDVLYARSKPRPLLVKSEFDTN